MLFRPQRHLTLANFHLRPGNQHAHAYALSLVQGSPRKYRSLLIVAGQSGRGKTHLVQAVANYAKRNESIDSSNILSAKQLADAVHKGIYFDDLPLLDYQLRNCDFLAIDDVDQLTEENFLAGFLLEILQHRRSLGRVTLLSITLGFAPYKASRLCEFLDRQMAVYLD